MNEAYIPAIITASVALIAAAGAQFLSHYLNKRREDKKENNEIYQEFIYPFLPEVLLYYVTETDFMKGKDLEKEVDLQNLLERISQKVSYGNTKLLSSYYQIKKMEHFSDGRGYTRERNILRFMFWYLDYAFAILNQKKSKEEKLVDEVKRIQKLYGLWAIIAEEVEYNLASELMMYDFNFNQDFFLNLDMKTLRELVDIEDGVNKRRSAFLKKFINEWQGGFEAPAVEEVKLHLEENYAGG